MWVYCQVEGNADGLPRTIRWSRLSYQAFQRPYIERIVGKVLEIRCGNRETKLARKPRRVGCRLHDLVQAVRKLGDLATQELEKKGERRSPQKFNGIGWAVGYI